MLGHNSHFLIFLNQLQQQSHSNFLSPLSNFVNIFLSKFYLYHIPSMSSLQVFTFIISHQQSNQRFLSKILSLSHPINNHQHSNNQINNFSLYHLFNPNFLNEIQNFKIPCTVTPIVMANHNNYICF